MNSLLIIGSILALVGVIGSIIPMLPGPALSYSALIILYLVAGASGISLLTLGIFGVSLILISILSYVAPIWGARFAGASRRGIIGAILGALLGFIFFMPLGIIIGAFLGALIGEISTGSSLANSSKAALGTLIGSATVIILQTVFSFVSAVYFFWQLFAHPV